MPDALDPKPSLIGRDIVCVGFAEWDAELWTNQQHLMARLAAHNRVLFIESLGLRRPQLSTGRDLRRIGRRLWRGLRPTRRITTPFGDVHVLSPLMVPRHDLAAVRALNARLLPALVRRALDRAGLGPHAVLWAYVPQAEALLDVLDPSLVVYHCVDDIAAQDGIHAASFVAAERRFAHRADLVLATAPRLVDRMRELNPNVLYTPNVADTTAFAAALDPGPVDEAVAALPQPRIVFTGAIAEKKIDMQLLAGLARERPEWSIVLVGPVGLGNPSTDVAALRAEPNIHLLGSRRYEELPAVLRGADAALVPYRLTRLTASIFPMKVYEYLSAGLPVVATPLSALAGLDAITVAVDGAETAAALTLEMERDTPERRRQRSAAAAEWSWEARIVQIDAAVAALSPREERP